MALTINDIQARMRAAGSHWWDPDALAFFQSRVESPVYNGPGGVYFVSSEQGPDGVRRYTVRSFNTATDEIDTAGKFQGFRSRNDAMAAALEASEGDHSADVHVRLEAHRPVKPADQFAHDIEVHTGKKPRSVDVVELVCAARQMHRLREDQCNGTNPCADARHELAPEDCPACDGTGVALMGRAKFRCERAALAVGAEAVLSGDPRGCVFKLKFPDGATNDWGREGWCVPRDLRGDMPETYREADQL